MYRFSVIRFREVIQQSTRNKLAPNLYHSQSKDLYADIGASKINIGCLTDFVKPKKKMTLTAFEEPSLKEIQDILN